ncbi:hypothetical protein K504DRAFT_464019 [Pleomassaria siparia CBS 279.74]|uniref:HRDC domain-containing protein n=1 Tax=Pleomassaria siparia CBS 279.74 TaxID=1314801 RepID=A0A6G1JQD0_9PLEO|nr:hypothetical protein K504DRAFT_464019 [Pleomassaria siparia CBS 279.74]
MPREHLTRPDDAAKHVGDKGPNWPMSYKLRLPRNPHLGIISAKPWWTHELYLGPDAKPVEVLYSKSQVESELVAQNFVDEAVLGFDMEWPIYPTSNRLQEKIGLIQIASENKIGLFHIGLHDGTTPEQIIAPSLRKIIESPSITKTGVAILKADFSRLQNMFGLKPQGAFELSHLHRLVTFGARRPELITTKMVALAYQVEQHLGLPLSKGAVRTSNWSRPLNQQQMTYAAADAYAGFMLYHCMNAKRLAMRPTPPLPVFADKYPLTGSRSKLNPLLLHPLEQGGSLTTIAGFFGLDKKKEEQGPQVPSEAKGSKANSTTKAAEAKVGNKQEKRKLDGLSQALYKDLVVRRTALAADENLPVYLIAPNAVLEGLAELRPLDDDALLQVKGIGKRMQEKYGAEWLQVIALFLSSHDIKSFEPGTGMCSASSVSALDARAPALPVARTRRRKVPLVGEVEDTASSSPAFGTPPQQARVLHTGISFTMAATNLDFGGEDEKEGQDEDEEKEKDKDKDENQEEHKGGLSDSCSSSVYVIWPSMSTCQLKRKRTESSLDARSLTGPPMAPIIASKIPSLERKIFRNKLLALSKLVSRMLKPPPRAPIVSEGTLDLISSTIPRTREELGRIPGIDTFVEACQCVEKDLLGFIHKHAPAG